MKSLSNTKNAPEVASLPKSSPEKAFKHLSQDHMVKGVVGDAALFLLKVAALETVRRFSRAKCPLAWHGLQAFQVVCFPPFKWIQTWAPFKGLVKGMQMLSRPLLVISVAAALTEQSEKQSASDDHNGSHVHPDADADSSSEFSSATDACPSEKSSELLPSENWLINLYKELERQGINLPERLNENELRRFYSAANEDFLCLLSSIKKTIRWRETYAILTGQELEMWSGVVFWHGYDVRQQPCLFVRLGSACTSLPIHDRPKFAQAIVSQMEHGILRLVDEENARITVVVDCERLSPWRLPMQVMRSCCVLLRDHFPNRLACLFVIRLPPAVRIMAQTLVHVVRPATRQKLRFIGEKYHEVLSEYLQDLPVYLGGKCICARCSSALVEDTRHTTSIAATVQTQLTRNFFDDEDVDMEVHPSGPIDIGNGQDFQQIVRTAMIGILMLLALIAFMSGVFDP